MAKTRIYLDVDGVINAIPAHAHKEEVTGWSTWGREKVHGFWITYAEEVLRALEGFHAEDDVEVVWLTTWRELATAELAPALNFKATDWRVVTDGDLPRGYRMVGLNEYGWGHWWKASTIVNDLVENPVDRVVWLDDDSNHYLDAVLEVKNTFSHVEFLVIGPDTSLGLTAQHINQVRHFLDTAEDSVVS